MMMMSYALKVHWIKASAKCRHGFILGHSRSSLLMWRLRIEILYDF